MSVVCRERRTLRGCLLVGATPERSEVTGDVVGVLYGCVDVANVGGVKIGMSKKVIGGECSSVISTRNISARHRCQIGVWDLKSLKCIRSWKAKRSEWQDNRWHVLLANKQNMAPPKNAKNGHRARDAIVFAKGSYLVIVWSPTLDAVDTQNTSPDTHDETGEVNQAGVDHYKNVINALLAKGITPYVIIFHWDTPLALEDTYKSWLSP